MLNKRNHIKNSTTVWFHLHEIQKLVYSDRKIGIVVASDSWELTGRRHKGKSDENNLNPNRSTYHTSIYWSKLITLDN